MSNGIQYLRMGVNLIVGTGVTKIVNDTIMKNTNIVTTQDKVVVWAGKAVLSWMVADKSKEFVDTQMDQLSEWVESRRTEKAH